MLLVSAETGKPFTGSAGVPAPNERVARTRNAKRKMASGQACEGKPKGGWFPAERITIEDAIRAYTYNTAYANFEEKIKGSIEVGKLADLTVLSQNLLRIPPREMLTTEVLYTIVDGKIVYEKVR
jgi:predicted amidohydrolase YtcJ